PTAGSAGAARAAAVPPGRSRLPHRAGARGGLARAAAGQRREARRAGGPECAIPAGWPEDRELRHRRAIGRPGVRAGPRPGARGAARQAGLAQLPIVSLAKREEEIYQPGEAEPLRLSRRSPSLKLLQRARDEAHRFAVSYSRQRGARRTITSELLAIPGIGP